MIIIDENKLIIEIWEIFNSIQMDRDRIIRQVKSKTNLTIPLIRLLIQIDEFGTATQTKIAKSLEMDLGNLSRMVKDLENKGLILRICSKTDKRARNVSLTKEGKFLVDDLMANCKKSIIPYLDIYSEDEIKEMHTGMMRFIEMSKNMREQFINE